MLRQSFGCSHQSFYRLINEFKYFFRVIVKIAAALDTIIISGYLGHHLMQQYVIVKLQLVVLSCLQQRNEAK